VVGYLSIAVAFKALVPYGPSKLTESAHEYHTRGHRQGTDHSMEGGSRAISVRSCTSNLSEGDLRRPLSDCWRSQTRSASRFSKSRTKRRPVGHVSVEDHGRHQSSLAHNPTSSQK